MPNNRSPLPLPLPLPAPDLNASLPWLTLSVILPCAFEYGYMALTAASVYAATPAERLREIIIVDDGSSPPLAPFFPEASSYKALVP